MKDWFTQPTAEFVTAPLVFKRNDKDIVAAATKDGRVLLLDAASLGGANHATPLYASRPLVAARTTFAPDALAMWQEAIPAPPSAHPRRRASSRRAPVRPAHRRLLPHRRFAGHVVCCSCRSPAGWPPDRAVPSANGAITNGAILALKIVDTGGTLSLQPGWVSRDLTSPVTPIIVNGVVFTALEPGNIARRGALRAQRHDGKELWNSGKAMTQPLSGRSFWSAMGQIYVGAADGTVYTFGFRDERR